MDLTRAAIEKSRITAVALLVVLVGGITGYVGVGRAEDPGFTIRIAQVTALLPGMNPERVDALITDKIEEAIQEMPEVEVVSSTSRTGASIVVVQVRDEYDELDPIWNDLRRKMSDVAVSLPAGVVGPMVNDAFGDIFGSLITLTGNYSPAAMKMIADEVREELLLIDDVAKVDVYGVQAERIFIDYDDARLAELGLAPLQLRSILESVNMTIPGGAIRAGTERIPVEPSGDFRSVDELRHTVITLPGRSEIVHLDDVVEISRGYVDPPIGVARASGAPALVLGIAMREGGDIIALGEEVSSAIARMQAAYPAGVEFDIVAFQPEVVDAMLRTFGANLFQAVFIVLAMALLFLGLRVGLVVSSLVPMAIIAALLVMSFLDVGLDQVSLAALIISLGLLVDNGIVMAESIMVRMAQGRQRVEAAVGSARELRVPLLISSLTTAAAFFPIFLAQSTTGEYTAPLFVVVTVTLLSSWILALTMTPLLCVRFFKVRPVTATERFTGRVYRWYRLLLLACLQHPIRSLTLVSCLLVLALQGFRVVPRNFFPPSNRPTFTAAYELPAGTAIERTLEVVAAIDRFIARELQVGELEGGAPRDAADGPERAEGVNNWVTFVGNGGPRFYLAHEPERLNPQHAFSILNATSRDIITTDLIPRLDAFCFEQFPDLRVILHPLRIGPPATPPIQVRLSGRDQDALFAIANTVKARLRAIPGTRQIADDWGVRSKKISVEVDQSRARRAGVTNQDVAISLQTALGGIEATQYRGDDEIVPVTFRSSAVSRTGDANLDGLNVYVQSTGRATPLLQVADATVVWELSTIRRRNRLKTVTVSSDLGPGGSSSEVVAQLRPWLEAEQAGWPMGYRYEFGGEAEESARANRSITEQLPIAGMIIVLLLVSQFNSVRRAAIILLTIPLGLIGVVAGLLVTQSYFGFMALLGGVALTGIVVNNAIILIDRIEIEIGQGLDPARAIVMAAQRRFRPILLTTATTVVGTLPLWIGGGPMWEPMAITIIFGLLFATVLTLGVVPLFYSLFFRVRFDALQYVRTRLHVDAYPQIDKFLTDFAARHGWSGALVDRIRTVGEETLLALVQQQDASPRRQQHHLLLTARRDGAAAELEFVSVTEGANIEDRIALFKERPAAESIEEDASLRMLRHFASSVRQQRYYDTDIVTVRVGPDGAPPASGSDPEHEAATGMPSQEGHE